MSFRLGKFDTGRPSGGHTKSEPPRGPRGVDWARVMAPDAPGLQQWRDGIDTLPAAEHSRGTAGVYGGDWDMVTVYADNLKFPVGESQVGVMRFQLSPVPTDHAGTLYVSRPLVAVRRIRVGAFSWPTEPASSLPALKTNRAEVGIAVGELGTRWSFAAGNRRAHFVGKLSTYECVSFLYYQGTATATITDAINRSIGAETEWYNDTLQMAPPATIDSLTLDITRGAQQVTFLPVRVSVTFDFTNGAADDKVRMSLASGAAHQLEAGMVIVFTEAVTDGAGTPLTVTEFAVDGSATIDTVVSATVVDFATSVIDLSTAAYTGTGAAVTVLVPARRVLIPFEFEVARVERE
jgi:hypothetical protein